MVASGPHIWTSGTPHPGRDRAVDASQMAIWPLTPWSRDALLKKIDSERLPIESFVFTCGLVNFQECFRPKLSRVPSPRPGSAQGPKLGPLVNPQTFYGPCLDGPSGLTAASQPLLLLL
ncbi:hypothetical protein MG293_010209 [Ovis ammon polii]|uniref:Uncharacterized protein n=1 Tax=Ovis ammon polii TaxID=230172 RepID=A0AAD4Y9M1_OVIAM|nr:hypothetical protein MG293_010209 [Ovis ammon polii]